LGKSSSRNDYKGIVASLSSNGQYPTSMQKSFTLQPGFHNLVAISAEHYSVTEDLKQLDPSVRNCYFPDETSEIDMFKNYTSSNCLLNCWLKEVGIQMEKLGYNCLPLNLFLINPKNLSMCDPFQSEIFNHLFGISMSINKCLDCLPDCAHTVYHHALSVEPFRDQFYKDIFL